MSDLRTRIARRAALPVIAVLIAASAMLWHHLPVPTQIYAPFDVHGSGGNPVRGTSLAVTATRVQIAPKGKFYMSQRFSNTLSAGGTWLVVDATVSALTSTTRPTADLVVGGNTYLPSSETPPGFGGQVDPGLPQHGHWVFDVAPELLQPSIARPLQLRVWSDSETRLNSRLVIDLDAKRLERADAVTVRPYEVGPAE
jgi:hypothetical protein